MKVVLCYPPLLPGQKPKYGLQPMGILYIGAVLQQHGIQVSVIDADIEGFTLRETVDKIQAEDPDLIGFSIMTSQLASALEASRLLKMGHSNTPIVLGGAHISSTFDNTFSFADYFDFAVYGEGEYTMLEVIRRMEKESLPDCLEGVKGVIYRNSEGEVVVNPPPGLGA